MNRFVIISILIFGVSLFIANETFISFCGDTLTLIDTSHAFTENSGKNINFLSNSFYVNLLDPISRLLQEYGHAASVVTVLMVNILFAFFLRAPQKIYSGVMFLISLFLIFGIDSFILPLMAYCALFSLLLERKSLFSKVVSVLFFIFIGFKIPAFSLLLYFLFFIGVHENENRKDSISLVCFLIACVLQFLVEPLRLDSYPEFSRVIKEVTPFVDSWIGESLPFAVTTEKIFFEVIIFPLMALFLVALNEVRVQGSLKLKMSCTLMGVLILEILCVQLFHDSTVSLLQALVRLIPHGSVYAVGGFLFAYSLLYFFLEARPLSGFAYLIFLSIFLFVQKTPVLLSPMSEFKNLKSIASVYAHSPVYTSPSLRILLDEGEKVMLAPMRAVLRSRSLDRFPFHIKAFSHSELLERINSQELSKRWASLTSHQVGNEWIQISFIEPQELKGLTLFPGEFQTDYPRGLKIESGSKSCDSLATVYEANPYEGSILRTAEGFPYRTTPNLGEVLFNQTISTSCLKISQIGVTNDYDWSISVIRLLQ